jgi:hypothetical protein
MYLYELVGEPDLLFRRMHVMDGGNSAKHMQTVGNQQTGDTCQFTESDYIIPCTYVDAFSNEAKSCQAPRDHQDDSDDENLAITAENDNPIPNDCRKTWKAAASDEKKEMWGIFDETGISISACRHGFLLWFVDMVKSSELCIHYNLRYFPH